MRSLFDAPGGALLSVCVDAVLGKENHQKKRPGISFLVFELEGSEDFLLSLEGLFLLFLPPIINEYY